MFADFMIQYVYEECFNFDDAAFAREIGMEESRVSSALLHLEDGIRDQDLVEQTLEYLSERQKLLLLVAEQYEIHNENKNAPKSTCPILQDLKKRLADVLSVTPESAQRQRGMELNKQLSILNDTVENVFCGRNLYHTIGCKAHGTEKTTSDTRSIPCGALAHLIEVFYENLEIPEEPHNPFSDLQDDLFDDE